MKHWKYLLIKLYGCNSCLLCIFARIIFWMNDTYDLTPQPTKFQKKRTHINVIGCWQLNHKVYKINCFHNQEILTYQNKQSAVLDKHWKLISITFYPVGIPLPGFFQQECQDHRFLLLEHLQWHQFL